MTNIQQQKREFRRIVRERRGHIAPEQYEEMSRLIVDRILSTEQYREAGCIFLYADMPGEVQMRQLLQQCIRDRKRAAAPRVEGSEMRYYYISAEDDLKEAPAGRFSIREPDPAVCMAADADETALIIMPGAAFDREHRRIGYGGGYYDKYLAAHDRHPTIAAAFEFQVFASIPEGEFDRRPDRIVTEKGIY